MTPQKVTRFFNILQQIDPEPEGELKSRNPYTLLVAVVLSAQATDVSVNKATTPLFKVVSTPEQMLELGLDRLKEFIRTIGLYNNKAANIIKLSRMLVDEFGSEVPGTREQLMSLPGVGRKSANVVLNIAFGEETIAVDTHIFRVGNRTGLAKGDTPRQVEAGLMKVVPARFRRHAHHWLILHGRYICTARKPKCDRCPVAELCGFKEKNL